MSQQPATFTVGGGLDQASPAIAISGGRVRAGMNYEPIAEGYGSVDGYERFDGRALPSSTLFWVLPFSFGSSAIVAGNVITGQTSGATATVLIDPVDPTGSWANGTAGGSLVLVNLSGQFAIGENIRVGGTLKAVATSAAVVRGADTVEREDAWLEEAQTWRRMQIDKVPGEGPVRGVIELKGEIYAIRNVIGGVFAKIWKATPAGWSEITNTGRRLNFTAGLVEIEPGQTITGATSGAQAVVERVQRKTGDWGSSAAGYLVLSGQVGNFVSEAIKVGTTSVASVAANSTVNNLPAGGRYRSIVHNFYGSANFVRAYAVNGVGTAFEFDGNIICPIETETPDDRPTHIAEIANHLVLGFIGGSVQISSDEDPVNFNGELGAAEFGLGTDITDMQQAAETALVVFGQQKIGILTGTDVDTFNFETLTESAGAEPFTAQKMGQTIYMDRRGLRSLQATNAYGNFRAGTMTELIEPLLRAKQRAGARPVASVVSRSKGHYRLFWSDGTGISVYTGRKYPEVLPFELGDMRVFCAMVCELPDYSEGIFVGAEDGYVYRLDSGTSHDGEAIRGFLMFPFNHLGSPIVSKRFHAVGIELEASPRTNIGILCQFDYADGEQPYDGGLDFFVEGSNGNDFVVSGGGGIWDASTWDSFFWSAPFEGEASTHIDGIGRNISLLLASRRKVTEGRHIIRSYSIFYRALQMSKRIVR